MILTPTSVLDSDFYNFLDRIHMRPGYWPNLSEDEKNRWVDMGARRLVTWIENPTQKQKAFWGFWTRVKAAEQAAVNITRLLDDQALRLGHADLCAYWTRVRISLRSGRYHG